MVKRIGILVLFSSLCMNFEGRLLAQEKGEAVDQNLASIDVGDLDYAAEGVRPISIQYPKKAKVRDVKKIVSRVYVVPVENFDLMLGSDRVLDKSLRMDAVLSLPRQDGVPTLNIKRKVFSAASKNWLAHTVLVGNPEDPNGLRLETIEYPAGATVREVKKILAKVFGLPITSFDLVFGKEGKILGDTLPMDEVLNWPKSGFPTLNIRRMSTPRNVRVRLAGLDGFEEFVYSYQDGMTVGDLKGIIAKDFSLDIRNISLINQVNHVIALDGDLLDWTVLVSKGAHAGVVHFEISQIKKDSVVGQVVPKIPTVVPMMQKTGRARVGVGVKKKRLSLEDLQAQVESLQHEVNQLYERVENSSFPSVEVKRINVLDLNSGMVKSIRYRIETSIRGFKELVSREFMIPVKDFDLLFDSELIPNEDLKFDAVLGGLTTVQMFCKKCLKDSVKKAENMTFEKLQRQVEGLQQEVNNLKNAVKTLRPH